MAPYSIPARLVFDTTHDHSSFPGRVTAPRPEMFPLSGATRPRRRRFPTCQWLGQRESHKQPGRDSQLAYPRSSHFTFLSGQAVALVYPSYRLLLMVIPFRPRKIKSRTSGRGRQDLPPQNSRPPTLYVSLSNHYTTYTQGSTYYYILYSIVRPESRKCSRGKGLRLIFSVSPK